MTDTVDFLLPHDFDRWALAARLRWWATAYAQLPSPNVRIIEDMREAATEVEVLASKE